MTLESIVTLSLRRGQIERLIEFMESVAYDREGLDPDEEAIRQDLCRAIGLPTGLEPFEDELPED